MKLKAIVRLLVFTIAALVVSISYVAVGKVSNANIPRPDVNAYLTDIGIPQGEEAFNAYLSSHPDDRQARFSLGILQFFGAVETLGQQLYRYGLDPNPAQQMGIPFLRFPVAMDNPNPEPMDYEHWRDLFETLEENLQAAEATLDRVGDDRVKVPVRFAQIRLDLNGDGTLNEAEEFLQIYQTYNRNIDANFIEQAKAFSIAFDTGDAYWLQGYCNLLMSMTDTILAYDTQELFERLGSRFFARVETPYSMPSTVPANRIWEADIADAIAAIHLLRLDPIEPERLAIALDRARTVIALSRQSWNAIVQETDNDREWIPNATQTSVIPAAVTGEQIDTWYLMLDEMERVLSGQKLLPHWRFPNDLGVNLERVFLEPDVFDLVLWVQGSAALPYLESGELTQTETWRELISVFGGNFVGFAIWFN